VTARGLSGKKAEVAFEKFLIDRGWQTERRKAVTTKVGKKFVTFSNDLFGCIDVLGLKPDESNGKSTWGAQVTTQKGANARRRKIEKIRWPASWRVSLVTHERVPDPADRRKNKSFWRISDYVGGEWKPAVAMEDQG